MVEQRPFKALVVGSSPTQPKIEVSAVRRWGAIGRVVPVRFEATQERHHDVPVRCSFSQFSWALLAGFTLLTPGQHSHPCLLLRLPSSKPALASYLYAASGPPL